MGFRDISISDPGWRGWTAVGIVFALPLAMALLTGCGGTPEADPNAAFAGAFGPPVRLQQPGLPYAFQLTPKVFAGAQPDGAASFAALQALGVKTVISVDGATPDVAGAEKFGLRYIHLPIGYDGMSVTRQQQVAKAMGETDGGVYIHCHHGKHRSATAAAAACVVTGTYSNDQAVIAMQAMKTDENYAGLWQAARTAKPAAEGELQALEVDFKAAQTPAGIAAAMVSIDQHSEFLVEIQQAGWKTPPGHPDLDPAHEALQLKELFTEMTRAADFADRPADFQVWTRASEITAGKLEAGLRAKAAVANGGDGRERLDAEFGAVRDNCMACHKVYRNVPQSAPGR